MSKKLQNKLNKLLDDKYFGELLNSNPDLLGEIKNLKEWNEDWDRWHLIKQRTKKINKIRNGTNRKID
jgi:hypothetical protein